MKSLHQASLLLALLATLSVASSGLAYGESAAPGADEPSTVAADPEPEEITSAPPASPTVAVAAAQDEDSGVGIPVLAILGGLLGLGLLAVLATLLLARGAVKRSKEGASSEAQAASTTARRATGREFDDVRRDLEGIREILRAGGMDAEVSRCREVERAVIGLQDQIRRLPSMGGPSASKVQESRGMALSDVAVWERGAALLAASTKLRTRIEAGHVGDILGDLDTLDRQVREAGAPHKNRPDPVAG